MDRVAGITSTGSKRPAALFGAAGEALSLRMTGSSGCRVWDSEGKEYLDYLMALGAVEAIAAAGKTGEIRVVGFDALDDAKKAIAGGSMDASVAQFPAEMGRVAVESAVKVIRGEKLPPNTMVKLEMVTKDSLGGKQE